MNIFRWLEILWELRTQNLSYVVQVHGACEDTHTTAEGGKKSMKVLRNQNVIILSTLYTSLNNYTTAALQPHGVL